MEINSPIRILIGRAIEGFMEKRGTFAVSCSSLPPLLVSSRPESAVLLVFLVDDFILSIHHVFLRATAGRILSLSGF